LSRLALRILVVFLLAVLAFLRWPIASPVHAGDISSDTDQSGSSDSGDAVGGQVVGVSSSGDASIDATNRSEDVDVSTGDASGSNTHDGTVNAPGGVDAEEFRAELISDLGLLGLPPDASDEDILDALEALGASPEDLEAIASILAGEFVGRDLESSTSQAGDVGTGDAVVGQTVGLVVTRRGQAELVLSNESLDSSVESGDAELTNASSSTVETTFVAAPK
jgi:hypothetical protein